MLYITLFAVEIVVFSISNFYISLAVFFDVAIVKLATWVGIFADLKSGDFGQVANC